MEQAVVKDEIQHGEAEEVPEKSGAIEKIESA